MSNIPPEQRLSVDLLRQIEHEIALGNGVSGAVLLGAIEQSVDLQLAAPLRDIVSKAAKYNGGIPFAYLHKAHRSFESCCKPAGNAIVIYGHSLAENDDHVLRAIVKGNARHLLVSLYGKADSSANKAIIEKAEKLVVQRGPAKGKHQALSVIYYDAASAKVWG